MKKLFLLILCLPLLTVRAAQQPTTSYPTGQYQAPFQVPWDTFTKVKQNLGITPEQEQKFNVGLQKIKDWFNRQDWFNQLRNRFFPPKGPQAPGYHVGNQPGIATTQALTKDMKQAESDIAQLQKAQAQRTGSITAKELQERRQGLRPVQREPLKIEESALLRDIKAKAKEFEQARQERAEKSLNPAY
jgi:hypothetical protein